MTGYAVGADPVSIAAGDLNNDENIDLVAANSDEDSISVLFGFGNGTFREQITYNTGSDPESVAVGSFRTKNKLDLVVANSKDKNIALFFNSC